MEKLMMNSISKNMIFYLLLFVIVYDVEYDMTQTKVNP